MTEGNATSLNSGISVSCIAKTDSMSGESSSISSLGFLKTVVGDLPVSCISESEELFQDLAMETISYSSEVFLQSLSKNVPCTRILTFISPESVAIELELQQLSLEINELPTVTATDTIVENSSYPSSSSLFRPDESGKSPPLQNTYDPTFTSRPSKELIKSQEFSLSGSSKGLSKAPSSDESPQAATATRLDSHLKSSGPAFTERTFREEGVIETAETQKHDASKDDKNGRQDEQPQDDSQQEPDEGDHNEKHSQTTKIGDSLPILKADVCLTVRDLQYRAQLSRASVNKNSPSSPAVTRKPASPLTMFSNIEKQKVNSQEDKEEGNVFIKFMRLMARILGQAEAEAHELYLRIKGRTDNVDLLTLLTSKVNSEKGAIDWKNDEEMKMLLQKAREIGVDIPVDKCTWSEDEKKLLKENIQMRKDSLEKITQLERTDMQRYLQEASQCHQARSNILKLLKEVIDTFVYNIRP